MPMHATIEQPLLVYHDPYLGWAYVQLSVVVSVVVVDVVALVYRGCLEVWMSVVVVNVLEDQKGSSSVSYRI